MEAGGLIVADRREGGVVDAGLPRAVRTLRGVLDSRVPLEAKILVPLVMVTVAVSIVFGYALDRQQQAAARAAAESEAIGVARSTVTAYVTSETDPTGLAAAIAAAERAQAGDTRIWVVSLSESGYPIVASGDPADVGKDSGLALLAPSETTSGATTQTVVDGGRTLETVIEVDAGRRAVVVLTSLTSEAAAARATAAWIAATVVAVCILEVVAAMIVLEATVLRRVRRIRATVQDFGHAVVGSAGLAGAPPEKGNDVLFNLAIEVDEKLVELGQRERVDDVIGDLGRLALQSAGPAELAQRALDVTRSAAGLETCFLVDARGNHLDLDSGAPDGRPHPALSVWVAALVRAAAAARRPILSDGVGAGSRYWEAVSSHDSAVAAFVPLPGPDEPLGIMVGIAGFGRRLAPASISLMEAVASTLGESLQRGEALKARRESDVKSEALSTVSHEMRSPINAMLSTTDLLLSGAAGELNEQQRDYVARVANASRDLLTLVNDYLDLASVMAGSLALNRELVAVAPEIEEVVKLHEPLAQARGVVVRISASPDLVANVDRLRLRQVLTNLVSNAIKFTDARGYVRVEAAGGANGVRISVIDTGIGIPLDRQHLVFREFAHIRADQTPGETGIGLALTKRFVDAMGGFIRFTSAPDAGTVFDVWLPGERSPVGDRPGAPAQAGVTTRPVDTSTSR